ncbi:4'-phosphopantetheinyl transferase family protein [Clostridium lacusfryxellense]|uniref:4'-phosphopantetheinyl transferase family protein n=1 Tax=Clostridium lacusfryxellense TaxID=205328 RepID=UPI001C0C9A90|nr:4'-phosphopantetheinyl transferase superfamily protein [Clostridium lacusfryxellense]MBU3112549.1 4'-phosphopantetheinyl transferase superfamily protein [Clostridium lacusfryxellense]
MKIYAVKILDINEEELEDLCLFISPDKKLKINRYINKQDKIRTLIGEILIRSIIVEKLKIKNKNIVFGTNKYGKPYLKDYPLMNFNISHSSEFVVCVIDDKSIGIDIEKVKHIKYDDIAKNFFSLSEFEYIIGQTLDFQLSKFYEIWTLKESYIKCCGQGLSIPLQSFSINMNQSEKIKVVHNNKHNEHIFKIFDIQLGYKMAVCSLNKDISNNIITIDQNSLINNYSKLDLE